MDPRKGSHTFSFVREGRREQETYDVFKLWEFAKDLPLEQADVYALVGNMDLKRKPWADPIAGMSKLMLEDDPAKRLKLMDHYQRIFSADLTYPLLLAPEPIGLADGHHRVIKAFIQRVRLLPAKRLLELPASARIPNKKY